MALDVQVNIKLSEVAGKSGTWFPCLLVVDTALEASTYKEYEGMEELETGTEAFAAATMLAMQNDAPKKFAILTLPAFTVEAVIPYIKKGWRQLTLTGAHDNESVKAIAKYIETTDKMLFVTVNEITSLTDLYETVKTYDRTFVVYHTNGKAAVAVVGATAGLNAGSFTYKNMKIKGIEAMELTGSEISAIHATGAITILEKVGDIVTSDGIVASGEFADIIDSKDYIVQNIAYNVQKVFNNNAKVPYTNNGIAMLEAATFEVLKTAYNNGMIADNEDGTPAYGTSFALRSETTENDRATRHYPYGKFNFALAGAIHTAEINGTVTV